jgi:hypothetical protein
MRVVMMIVTAAGCTLMALLFAKTPGEGGWQGAVMATLFAGMAGVLVAVAAGS